MRNHCHLLMNRECQYRLGIIDSDSRVESDIALKLN
ncbi:hypothetical protein A1Q_0377 [Vibrio campbellii HY01]|nr:hypothetical protein A1Q_0377 [Vibrio campbellii HY01]